MSAIFSSLFSGIGGFDLGFERAGMTCKDQVEIDKAAQSVLRRHFPEAELYEDVKTYTPNSPIDLICGGFPCQDVSIAGRREGLAGERSGLWFEFHRIIEAARPRWVVIENVPGLLSSNGGRDFAVILRGLVECGYGVAWRVLDAQYFGVAQRRRRVFIVASLGNGRAAQVLFERESLRGDTAPGRGEGKEVAGTLDRKSASSNQGSQANEAEFIVSTYKRRGGFGYSENQDISPTLESEGGTHQGSPVSTPKAAAPRVARQGKGAFTDPVNDNIIVAPTLTSANDPSRSPQSQEVTRQIEAVMLANWTSGGGKMDDNIAASLRSEAEKSYQFVWHNHQQDGSIRVQRDTVPTVSAQWGTGGNNVPFIGVRRLTPTECERLQGFPDGWTDGQSDSTRYRQLGNAVAVPCAEWIGKRIAMIEGGAA